MIRDVQCFDRQPHPRIVQCESFIHLELFPNAEIPKNRTRAGQQKLAEQRQDAPQILAQRFTLAADRQDPVPHGVDIK